ncbi:DUF3083 family protein [Thalassotalea profundi]|uniref:DUF3083 family protein n=1 Tax=Thalassotalea profundi TaxID=2036687 RepID=A0ABQ3IFJ5_9GAMM|nr:DUF3083 family protein [Thalassotalea profundi]GHE76918.1 hypothetical protein GCM10011501_00360 [Thalassotalea profundi]
MPISRARSTQHKVFIPKSARSNQYIMVKLPLTDAFVAKHAKLINKDSEQPYKALYQNLEESFFEINNKHDIESGQFIASDKFVRVRYSPERLTVETTQQILFLYNPRNHYSQNSYITGEKQVEKITLLYLANGDDVRVDSAKFHQRVSNALKEFMEKIGAQENTVRFCDHQHLTYDLFAKDKGVTGTTAHKFRTIKNRYAVDEVTMPEKRDVLTYVVADIPVNRRIKNLVDFDKSTNEPYQALYNEVNLAVSAAAKQFGLTDGAVIANDKFPIVRSRDKLRIKADGEILKLGFNPFEPCNTISFISDGNDLVDSIQIVFVATKDDKTSYGYGKFLNHVELALRSVASKLNYINEREELVVRVHQHIGYDL